MQLETKKPATVASLPTDTVAGKIHVDSAPIIPGRHDVLSSAFSIDANKYNPINANENRRRGPNTSFCPENFQKFTAKTAKKGRAGVGGVMLADPPYNASAHGGEPSFDATLDTRFFDRKPTGRETGGITNRLKAAGGATVTASQFCEHVRRGGTFVCGVHEPSRGSGWGRFLSQQIIALDFDNSTGDKGAGTDRALRPGESGYVDWLDALDRCYSIGLDPLCLYFTFSADANAGAMRFHLVVRMEEPTRDQRRCERRLGALMRVFPEADPACSNADSRLFFGSNGEVHEAWRVKGGAA